MSQSLGRRNRDLRRLSILAYALSFGALFGVAAYGYTRVNPDGSKDDILFWIYLGSALLGSVLLAAKNLRFPASQRVLLGAADVLVLAVALLLIVLLPSQMGLFRGAILIAIFFPYLIWYMRRLYGLETDPD
ncbi:MAG TPA: hypothetical protein VFC12_05940 [Terriglobales bacterium]|nr:hypothetical protein [Terriglobales bacterium]